jgi:hypothetical protein
MSPHQVARLGLEKITWIAEIVLENRNSSSMQISGKDLTDMLEGVELCLAIHLRAFAATKSTSGEKATDDSSTLLSNNDTLDYKSWNVTEVRIVLQQLKLDVGKANKITKEVWDETVRQAKAMLPVDMNLSSCIVTIGIILAMLHEPEREWVDP